MSQIRSNSIGSANIEDFQDLDKITLLDKLIKIPFNEGDDYSQDQQIDNLSKDVKKKLKLIIKHIISEITYKNTLKQIANNLSELDQVKISNGLKSIKKQIIKFNVFAKHHTIQQSRDVLTELILQVLTGQN